MALSKRTPVRPGYRATQEDPRHGPYLRSVQLVSWARVYARRKVRGGRECTSKSERYSKRQYSDCRRYGISLCSFWKKRSGSESNRGVEGVSKPKVCIFVSHRIDSSRVERNR